MTDAPATTLTAVAAHPDDSALPRVAVRLTALTLEGFKSFAKRTEFEFESGITGIVGPNGCGKSNLVDAFRWVLGSQSAKSLRGKDMTDVIFSGGTTGTPARFARVTLTFDNRDRYFGLDADTVEIARKLSRDGTSEYFVNGQPARLRDVKELMMDTGIGIEAYSIIEQGKIAVLLEANAGDRRRIFEEAAGISKFKIKRKQTLERLGKVEEKLGQIRLILDEISGNMRRVKSQAGKAAKYREYTTELNQLRARRGLIQFHTLLRQREQHLEEQAEAHKAQVLLDAQLEDLKGALEQDERKARQTQGKLAALRDEKHRVETQIAQRNATLEHQTARLTELADDRVRAAEAIKRHTGTRQSIQQRRADAEQALTQIERERNEIEAQWRQLQARETKLAEEVTKLEDNVQARRDTLFKLVQEQSAFTNELTALDGDLRHSNHQIGQANRKLTELEARLADVEAAIAEFDEEHTKIQADLARVQGEFDHHEVEAKKLEADLANLKDTIHGRAVQLSAAQSRVATLTQFIEGREGLPQGARELLDDADLRKRFGVLGLVADAFNVNDATNAVAIDAALSTLADAVLVKTETNAHNALLHLAQHGFGGTTLIALDKLTEYSKRADRAVTAPEADAVMGLASEMVTPTDGKFAPVVDALLGSTVVVTTLDHDREIFAALPDHAGVVTADGETLRHPGLFRGKPETTGLVTVRASLDKLAVEIETLEAELTRFREDEAQLIERREHAVTQLKSLRPKIYALQAADQENTKSLSYQNHERETLLRNKDTLGQEREQAEKDRHTAEEMRRKRQADLEASRKESEDAEKELDEAAVAVKDTKAKLAQLREAELSDARVALAEARQRFSATEERLGTLDLALKEAESQLELAKAEVTRAEDADKAARQAIEQAKADLETFATDTDKHQAAIDSTAELLKEHEDALTARREEIDRINGQLLDARGKHQEAQIRQQTCLEQITELKGRVREELEVDLEELVRRHGEGAAPAEGETVSVTDDDGKEIGIDVRIEQLQNKIRKLGNVNMEALDELSELENRNSHIVEQEQDLRKMMMQLRRILERLDTTCKERFQTTFDGIRTNFQQLFRKLFGGGKADVFLDDPNDLLGSGIEIVAKPPGKEPQTLTLLSGGERSLTALALLFSIFLTKPSPFCILDEVDAALDVANRDRFTALLTEFSRRAQFLVITHAKATMASASRLYGVTMQEAGVSKRIAIQFEEYDQFGKTG